MFRWKTMMIWPYLTSPTNADEELGVNTEPMATVNDTFRNTLADNTEDNDGISQLLRNVETGCLSER